MKIEIKSKISHYGTGRYHIEIPAYVRDDIEHFIGEKIKITNDSNKISFLSRVSTYGPNRVHVEIPASMNDNIKKFLGKKIKFVIKTL